MSKTYDEIKQMKVDATAYDPTVFDSTRSVLEQLEIIKEYISEFPTGFRVWSVPLNYFVDLLDISNLQPIGGNKDIGQPKVGDIVIFKNGEVHEITNIRQTSISVYLADINPEILANLKGPQGESIKGDPGVGVQDLASISFPYGVADITYDSTEGIHMFGGARLTFNNGIEPVEAAAEIEIPLQPGEGIVLDANENNDGVSVGLDAETNALLGRAIVAPINGVVEDSVPVVKPNRDVDYVPISQLGGGGGSGYYIFNADMIFEYGAFESYRMYLPRPDSSVSKIEVVSAVYSYNEYGYEFSRMQTFTNPYILYDNGVWTDTVDMEINYEIKPFVRGTIDGNTYYQIEISQYSGMYSMNPEKARFFVKVYF